MIFKKRIDLIRKMSFSERLTNSINTTVLNFIDVISTKYSLDKHEVVSLWTNGNTSSSNLPKPRLDTVDMTDFSLERLLKATKPELVALCKAKGEKTTGTKEVLISRLTGKQKTESSDSKSTLSLLNKGSVKEEKKAVPKKEEKKQPSLLQKITNSIPAIAIRRNKFGNFEHLESHLVLDKESETVYGKQQHDGSVSTLTDEDIDVCKKYKFKYKIPNNLDKDNLENVKVAELDDDIPNEKDEEVVEEDEEVVEDEDEEEIEIEDD